MQQKDYGISIRTAHNILAALLFEATVACSIIRVSLLLGLTSKTDTRMCHLCDFVRLIIESTTKINGFSFIQLSTSIFYYKVV